MDIVQWFDTLNGWAHVSGSRRPLRLFFVCFFFNEKRESYEQQTFLFLCALQDKHAHALEHDRPRAVVLFGNGTKKRERERVREPSELTVLFRGKIGRKKKRRRRHAALGGGATSARRFSLKYLIVFLLLFVKKREREENETTTTNSSSSSSSSSSSDFFLSKESINQTRTPLLVGI